MYKKKLYNMEAKRLPKIPSNSSQNYVQLKRWWHNHVNSSLNNWNIREMILSRNKDNIKNIITSKFKDMLWSDEELEGKIKLRYCNEVINPTPANQNYLYILTNAKKRMNITRIRANSHELQSETRSLYIPRIPLDETICLLCDTKRFSYEKNFIFDFLTLNPICSHFHNILPIINLIDLLSQENYNDLRTFLSLIFHRKTKILNNLN